MQLFQRRHSARHSHIELTVLYFFCPSMPGGNIGKPYGVAYSLDDLYFFTDAVHQVEGGVGKENGQGDTGKAATRSNIDDLHVFFELECRGNAQGVQNMLFIQAVDVLAGDDIDLIVPVLVQLFQGGQLLQLPGREIVEITEDQFQVVRGFFHIVGTKIR